MAMGIRSYQNRDYIGLYNLYLQFSPVEKPEEISEESPEKIHAWLNGLLGNSRYRHLVLEESEHILGHGMVCLTDSNTAHLCIFFGNTTISPSTERQLFASLVHEACKNLHLRRACVTSQDGDDSLLRLAEEFSFTPTQPQDFRRKECVLERRIGCEQCLHYACPFYEPSQSFAYPSPLSSAAVLTENTLENVPALNASLFLEAASYFAGMGQPINSLFFHKKNSA
jgi:hypothetical protein